MRPLLTRLWARRKVIILYALLVCGGWLLGELFRDVIIPEMRPMNEPMIHRIMMSLFVVFIIVTAIPFVPGAEIGFALLLVFGKQAAPLVYLGMVGALMSAYCIARLVPSSVLCRSLDWLGLKKASQLVADLDATRQNDRMTKLSLAMPSEIGQRLLRHRYLLLAVVLNTPGNSLVGGGGGLAFVAGASGVFAFWPFLIVVIFAVAPVPLFFLLT